MSRWKASAIHLLLSAAIAAAVLTVMLAVWYPWPLFEAAGGSRLVFILVGVDVTLGPLITLIIFKSGKPGLKFDLTVIALVQVAALAYGVYTVYLARPVYLVYTIDRFDLVTAKDLDLADLAQVTDPRFARAPLGRPRYIAAVMPVDPAQRLKIFDTALAGKDLQMYPQHYVPYEREVSNALAHAKPLDLLLQRDPQSMERALRAAGRDAQSLRFLPLRAPQVDGAVLLDAASGAPVDIVLVEPW
jgi:hypothetical protein